jgi:hypothetical protein
MSGRNRDETELRWNVCGIAVAFKVHVYSPMGVCIDSYAGIHVYTFTCTPT